MAMVDEFIGMDPMLEDEPVEQDPPSLDMIVGMLNIAPELPEDELGTIGEDVIKEYELDKASMKGWSGRMKKAVALAELVKDDKSYPFANPSNVRYPLVTSAALQFNARAYPAIVAADRIVKVKTFGEDVDGTKQARGDRVAEHMSWQLTSVIEEWEEETDKLLTLLPIVGTVIRKVWYDPARQRIRCRLVTPGAFVVHDKVRLLSDAPRCSEEITLYPGEITERKTTKLFREIDYTADGEKEDSEAAQTFIEQHRGLDLDGDGYREPYIVTVHRDSRKVARIVADYDMEDVVYGEAGVTSVRRNSYFVAYHFLPSLDGGFHGTGLGLLLGDISESINTIINLMIDAGHMASRGGGFLGSEFRIKGGTKQFAPGEWKMMTMTGAAIRDSIVPLTLPGPDATLFQLLGLLIEAGKDVTAVKDILTGDAGGKTQTATTTMALIEQGLAQFTAAYKRIFRSLRQEFRMIASINAQTVSPEEYNAFHDGQGMLDPAADYSLADMDITPVADPSSVTRMQEMGKAQMLMEMSQGGLVNPQVASQRILAAAGIADIEELIPQPDPMQQQMAEMQAQIAQADLIMRAVQLQKVLAEVEEIRSKTIKNVADAAETQMAAQLSELQLNLEVTRDGILRTLAGVAGGMAAAPGQPVGPQGPPEVDPFAEGGGDPSLLGGPPMDGGEPIGPDASGGFIG